MPGEPPPRHFRSKVGEGGHHRGVVRTRLIPADIGVRGNGGKGLINDCFDRADLLNQPRGDQNVIDQFNPVTGTIVSTLNGPGNFDQSAVDGKGHLFVASNSGFLEFADYRATGLIGTPTFTASPFLAPALDDIAPLSGLGGGGQVPEPSSILLFGTALAVVGYRLRKRAA